jgi:hypothetical protein
MAFDLSTATPVDEVPKDDSGLLPKPNDFPAVTKRAKQNKETDVQRLEQLVTPDLTEAAALVPGVASDFGSQAGNLGQGAFNYIKEHPLASAAVGGAAALGGQAVYKTLKDKILGGKTPNAAPNAEPELFSRIDPDLNVSQKPVVRPEPTFDMQGMTPAQPVAQSTPTTIEELKARLTATPEVPVAPVAQAPVQAPVQASPTVAPIAPVVPPASPTTPIAEAIPVSPESVEQAPTEAKKPRKVTPKVVPEGMTELVGGGPGDRWLANEHPALRKAIITQFNDGKPAGSYEKAQELYKQFKAYQAENIPGPVIPKQVAKERGMPPPKNYGAWGTKIAKGAGVTGLALTAAEMAQAAQAARQGDYGPARETGFNLLGMIPGLGTAFNALTFSKGAGETPEELQKLQYMQKVGAGQGFRGIAPPSR